MIELLKYFLFVSLIVTHPLEQISLDHYPTPDSSISFIDGLCYIAPDNGYVKNMVEKDGYFQITLLLDSGNEVVYTGLTEVRKRIGDRVFISEPIGTDVAISANTKFILMFYEKSVLFPQFVNNSLEFLVDKGTKASMIADGSIISAGYLSGMDLIAEGIYTEIDGCRIIPQSYVPKSAGYFSQIKLAMRKTYISYWHIMAILKELNTSLSQGEWIVASGNTGACLNPCLVLHIEDEELGNDIRVIYFRSNRKQ